tara:strand:- start:122 stop:610 length:489 start_codon:yes stop_codon:yes gene_type:complete
MEKINGRLDLINNVPNMPFILHDKIPVDRNTGFRDALNGNLINNTLSNLFFSAENITILQNGIRKGVYDNSQGNYLIDNQDYDVLKTIMRGIYLQYSANMETNITEQITSLNKLVLDFCIPTIVKEAQSYMIYRKDVSTIPDPISRPVLTQYSKTLQEKHFF